VDLPDQGFEWCHTVCGEVKEAVPKGAPEPLGKPATMAARVDANLFHGMLTGRSVTGGLRLVNGTLANWFAKKQATVEAAMHGSEFATARAATEQIIDLRTTLHHLGVPAREKSHTFGNSKSVIDSATARHAKLHKCHNALSFGGAQEAVAGKFVTFRWVGGSLNPAGVLSKHWGCQLIWPLLQALLFWEGNTIDLFDCQKCKQAEHRDKSGLSETEQPSLTKAEKN
jgi:hypothetical protein